MNARILLGNLGLGAVFRERRQHVHTAFVTHPKIANSCTGFFTFAAGDIFAHKLMASKEGN
jgi:hypothetical protein